MSQVDGLGSLERRTGDTIPWGHFDDAGSANPPLPWYACGLSASGTSFRRSDRRNALNEPGVLVNLTIGQCDRVGVETGGTWHRIARVV